MLVDIRFLSFLGMIIYLISSIPVSYIWIKSLKNGLNLDQVGTGNLGSSNTKNASGYLSAICISLIDIFLKGFLPIYVFDNIFGYSWELFIYGLLIVVGHNWSIFMSFKGGRGVAVSIGVLLAIETLRPIFLIIAIPVLISRLVVYKDSALWTLVAIILLVLMTFLLSSDIVERIFTLILAIFLISKRVLTNEWRFPDDPNRIKVLFYRIVFDRDIKSKYLWINQ
mgnify:CR=1 FL=1